MNTAIKLFKRRDYFSDAFPLAIRRLLNRTEDFNAEQRFQREFWKITYLVGGRGNLILDAAEYPIHAGSIMLIHPSAVTTYRMSTAAFDLYNLVFDARFLEQELASLQDDFQFFSIFSPTFRQTATAPLYILEAGRRIGTLIRTMAREDDEKEANYRNMLKAQLLELLILMLRAGERKVYNRRPENIIGYVNRMLELHFREEVNLPALSRQIGVTENHLCRIYKKFTGRTMIARLQQLRLDAAAEALRRQPDRTISEIGYDCGFNDLSYFYRLFARRFGVCPGAFQKKLDHIDF